MRSLGEVYPNVERYQLPMVGAVMSHELDAFYSARSETGRLLRGLGQLEFVRTRELLSRFVPDNKSVIYDVGGGPGYYSGWLAEQGHEVHLIDPFPHHAETASQQHPALASARVGDARTLPWPNQSADVVLLMGPLYHLTDRPDRLRALEEARRVLRPNGILFAVVIPRWASALVGMQRGWVYDGDYAQMVREELESGRHLRPSTWPRLFMDGYFHSAGDIRSEISDAGLMLEQLLAIEGPAWMSQDFDTSWEDPMKREEILRLSRAAEAVPELLAASPHVAALARPTA